MRLGRAGAATVGSERRAAARPSLSGLERRWGGAGSLAPASASSPAFSPAFSPASSPASVSAPSPASARST